VRIDASLAFALSINQTLPADENIETKTWRNNTNTILQIKKKDSTSTIIFEKDTPLKLLRGKVKKLSQLKKFMMSFQTLANIFIKPQLLKGVQSLHWRSKFLLGFFPTFAVGRSKDTHSGSAEKLKRG
jgi:hypothetical protein